MNLYVFDIDGTMVSKDLVLSERLVNNINKLIIEGNIVCLASGRCLAGLKQFKDRFIKNSVYSIACNGALIYDPNEKLIYSSLLKYKDLKDIYIHFGINNKHLCFMVYKDSKIGYLADNNNSYIERECLSNKMDSFKIELDTLKDEELIEKVMIESKHLDNIEEKIIVNYKNKYNIVKGAPNFLEFSNIGVDKYFGIKKLIAYLDISFDNVFTFGDSNNDYLMIKNFYGIAMGNALSSIKEVSKAVIKPCNKEGISMYLESKNFGVK